MAPLCGIQYWHSFILHINLLEQNMNQIAGLDIKIILGDFNAKVEIESIYKP